MAEATRFFPADPDETFRALAACVREFAKPQSIDEFSRSATFKTRMTGFTSGAQMTASVLTTDGGSIVRVDGAARMKSQLAGNSVAQRQAGEMLDHVSATLQAWRAQRGQ